MMNYVKPDVFVTKFSANAFCSNCIATEYNKPVTVNCIISSSETVYDSGVNGCDYFGTNLIYVANDIIYYGNNDRGARLAAIQDLEDGVAGDDSRGSGWSQYTLESGYYLAWTDGRTPHAGPVPATTSDSIKNHS